MQLIRGLYNLPSHFHDCVATMGNFDGMHRGHQAILTELITQAQARQLPAVVIVFEPQPREFFTPQQAPARLLRLVEKIQFLQGMPIDYVLCLRFTQSFAQQTASDFVQSVLVDAIGARLLIIGEDVRFGYQRQGNVQLLRSLGANNAMDVMVMPTIHQQDKRASSTWVRQALAHGNLSLARQLLERDYSLWGRVVRGQQRGRTIGVPTANIQLKRGVIPLSGVYAVHVEHAQQRYRGIANIGSRPTVGGGLPQLEAHLFDFDGDLYGKRLRVTFLHKLRDEQRFASFELLKTQIWQDIAAARAVLAEFKLS